MNAIRNPLFARGVCIRRNIRSCITRKKAGMVRREDLIFMIVSVPFDFEREYGAAMQGELAPGLVVRFVSIRALIEMKRLANRPRDLGDIEHLRMILEEQRRNDRKS